MELEYIAEWFQFADMDFTSAEHLQSMHPQPLEYARQIQGFELLTALRNELG